MFRMSLFNEALISTILFPIAFNGCIQRKYSIYELNESIRRVHSASDINFIIPFTNSPGLQPRACQIRSNTSSNSSGWLIFVASLRFALARKETGLCEIIKLTSSQEKKQFGPSVLGVSDVYGPSALGVSNVYGPSALGVSNVGCQSTFIPIPPPLSDQGKTILPPKTAIFQGHNGSLFVFKRFSKISKAFALKNTWNTNVFLKKW